MIFCRRASPVTKIRETQRGYYPSLLYRHGIPRPVPEVRPDSFASNRNLTRCNESWFHLDVKVRGSNKPCFGKENEVLDLPAKLSACCSRTHQHCGRRFFRKRVRNMRSKRIAKGRDVVRRQTLDAEPALLRRASLSGR